MTLGLFPKPVWLNAFTARLCKKHRACQVPARLKESQSTKPRVARACSIASSAQVVQHPPITCTFSHSVTTLSSLLLRQPPHSIENRRARRLIGGAKAPFHVRAWSSSCRTRAPRSEIHSQKAIEARCQHYEGHLWCRCQDCPLSPWRNEIKLASLRVGSKTSGFSKILVSRFAMEITY